MKRIYDIFAVALLALAMPLMTACGDDDFEEKTSTVQVVSATTAIPVMGGSAAINVTGEGITATSSASWLTVSVAGNTVDLQAAGNTSKQSRNALVTISAANGDKTVVNVSQVGMVVDLVADGSYIFEGTGNADVEIVDNSNVDFESVVTANWIQLVKTDKGYVLNVADNDGNELRTGSVTLRYGDFSHQMTILQWGAEYPFTTLNTATYTDENGIAQTKSVTIEKDPSKEGQYLIKGLVPEGDVLLMPNTVDGKKEWYIPSGHAVGSKVVGSTTFYLRCMMSCTNLNTGNRYIPATKTNVGTSAYRMTFDWAIDDNQQPYLYYFRNATLGTTYSTDGFIVCRYKNASGVTASARDGIEYYFLDIEFSKQ